MAQARFIDRVKLFRDADINVLEKAINEWLDSVDYSITEIKSVDMDPVLQTNRDHMIYVMTIHFKIRVDE